MRIDTARMLVLLGHFAGQRSVGREKVQMPPPGEIDALINELMKETREPESTNPRPKAGAGNGGSLTWGFP